MTNRLLLKHVKAYMNEFDVTGDSRMLDSLGGSAAPIPAHNWSEGVRSFVADKILDAGVRNYQAMLNDAAGGLYKELAEGDDIIATLALGEFAAPAVGDLAYIVDGTFMGKVTSFDDRLAMISGDILSRTDIGGDWGRILYDETELVASDNGDSVDDGASSLNGGEFILHILESTAGNYAFKVQDSADGMAWADLVSWVADGSVVGVERVTKVGTIRRYVRLVATRTAGTVTIVSSYIRK